MLFVSTHLGGAERSSLEYIKHAAADPRFQLDLLFPKSEGPFLEELDRLGIRYSVLPMPAPLLQTTRSSGSPASFLLALLPQHGPRYFWRLLRHLRRTSPDLIYTTGIKCHFLGAALSLVTRTPVLWHLRDHFASRTGRVLAGLYRLPGVGAVANSRSTALSLSDARPPAVVYNGIDAAEYSFGRSERLRELCPIPAGRKIIGIVGVLAPWKGQREFLGMARRLLEHRKDLHFVIVGDHIYDTSGDQSYRQELEEYSASLGIAGHVSFTGFQRDVVPLLQSMDVLVHASVKPEPFGRVIIEAMACGTPVTASRAGGPLEILRENIDGLFHQPGDCLGMARNVELLLEGETKAHLTQAARVSFLENFTSESYVRNLHERLSQALN